MQLIHIKEHKHSLVDISRSCCQSVQEFNSTQTSVTLGVRCFWKQEQTLVVFECIVFIYSSIEDTV